MIFSSQWYYSILCVRGQPVVHMYIVYMYMFNFNVGQLQYHIFYTRTVDAHTVHDKNSDPMLCLCTDDESLCCARTCAPVGV